MGGQKIVLGKGRVRAMERHITSWQSVSATAGNSAHYYLLCGAWGGGGGRRSLGYCSKELEVNPSQESEVPSRQGAKGAGGRLAN